MKRQTVPVSAAVRVCVSEWFDDDQALIPKIFDGVAIQKFIQRNIDFFFVRCKPTKKKTRKISALIFVYTKRHKKKSNADVMFRYVDRYDWPSIQYLMNNVPSKSRSCANNITPTIRFFLSMFRIGTSTHTHWRARNDRFRAIHTRSAHTLTQRYVTVETLLT